MADVGLVWQEPLLRAMGIPCAPQSFANSAARVILRCALLGMNGRASRVWSMKRIDELIFLPGYTVYRNASYNRFG